MLHVLGCPAGAAPVAASLITCKQCSRCCTPLLHPAAAPPHACPAQVSYDELTYDGQGMDSFVPERTAIYVSQLDNHFGGLLPPICCLPRWRFVPNTQAACLPAGTSQI